MKNVKSIIFLLLIAMLSLSTPSCKKDAATSNLKVTIQASNTTYSLPVSGVSSKSAAASPSISWVSGTMFVSQLAFKAEMGESATSATKAKIQYDWKGPLNINLFDASSNIGNIALPLGYYDKLEFEIKSNKSDAASSPVVYLTGNYTNASGTVIPVIFTSSEDMSFKAKQDGVTITAVSSSNFTASIQILMDQALMGMTLAQLDNAPLTNNKLVISATSNAMLYNMMINNMMAYQQCKFVKD